MIQVVDLAAKFSAGMLRTTDGEILDQFDSLGKTPFEFAAIIARNARRADCELTLVEDVPYSKMLTQAMTKPVTRFQGVIMAYCHPVLENVKWVNPSSWMGLFPGVQTAPRGMTKSQADKHRIEQAYLHARLRGYEPPDLVAEYVAGLPAGTRVLKKNTEHLTKTMTDYVSSFLISEWALQVWRELGRPGFDSLQGVQPSMI